MRQNLRADFDGLSVVVKMAVGAFPEPYERSWYNANFVQAWADLNKIQHDERLPFRVEFYLNKTLTQWRPDVPLAP